MSIEDWPRRQPWLGDGLMRGQFLKSNGDSRLIDADPGTFSGHDHELAVSIKRGPKGGWLYMMNGKEYEAMKEPSEADRTIRFLKQWEIPSLFALYTEDLDE